MNGWRWDAGGFVKAALPRWRWLVMSLAGRGSAARYEGIARGALQEVGQSGEFVGAALLRWRWLVLSLAGCGSAARYEDKALFALLGVDGDSELVKANLDRACFVGQAGHGLAVKILIGQLVHHGFE
jgi:hypothetical protein